MTFETTLSRFDEAKIDAIFADLNQCHKPGAAVAIAIGGRPVYRKGFGLANIELPVLLSPTIRMRIGSTTKHFACLAYLLLCEDGKAGIDDPVEKHVPEIHPVAHGVTMRQLMGHTSGLRDMLSVTLLTNGTSAPVTDRQAVACYETIDDVDFVPGTAWSYNNGGYQLLSVAIERLAGEPLEEMLRKRIFAPVGMNDTLLRRWERDFVPNSATLHTVDGEGRFGRDYLSSELTGSGGMASTMDDMLIWLKHMDAPIVGSAATWELIRRPQRLASGHSTGYGLGLMTVPYRGVETVTHAGALMGGNSQMIKVPSAGLDISLAVNRGDASATDLAARIIDLLVDGLTPQPDKSGAEPINRLYLSSTSGRVVELTAKETAQLFALDGSAGTPVERDEAGALQLPEIVRYLQTSFAPGERSGRLVEFGNADLFHEIEPDRSAKLGDHAGTYRSAMLGAEAEVTEAGDGPSLAIVGRHGRTSLALTPLTGRIWRVVGRGALAAVAGIVTFDAEGFEITFTRMKRLRFVRVAQP